MSKVIYQYQPEPLPQAEPPKPDPRPSVTYHAKAALIIGVFITAAILLIGLAAGAKVSPLWRWAIGAGALAAVLFAVPSTAITTIYEWWIDWVENHRRWKAENEARYNAVAAEVVDDYTVSDTERLELVCWRILRMHYHQGREATRPECERAGIGQTDWNNTNRLLQLIGLKGERGWLVKDEREAFDRFEACVQFDRDMIFYSPSPSETTRLRFMPGND